MNDAQTDLAGVVLAAGAGTRLRPLTLELPKALCPVDHEPLVDHALRRVARHSPSLAVNVHHGREAMLRHLDGGDVHVSVEDVEALGTAGGVARLRSWIDGRPALVLNADAWGTDPLDRLLEGWDGTTVRLLVEVATSEADFEGSWRFAGASLTPWELIRELDPEPSGLYEVLWQELEDRGRLELIPTTGVSIDCGTPRDYLLANLTASGGTSVVSDRAVVEGEVHRSVVWPGARVEVGERLEYAVRTPEVTVQAGRN